jgi:hypothetical protein
MSSPPKAFDSKHRQWPFAAALLSKPQDRPETDATVCGDRFGKAMMRHPIPEMGKLMQRFAFENALLIWEV